MTSRSNSDGIPGQSNYFPLPGHLVNAVELQEFDLWKDNMPDFGVLQLLLSLMDEESQERAYHLQAKETNIP